MKIGIISDTHSKVKMAKDAIDLLIENGAEFIIHSGDIGESETLDYLENCSAPYVAVYGNNDAHLAEFHSKYNLVQEPYYFKLADTKFKLMHLPFYMSGDADVVIFGHTHTFESDFKGKTLFLNSGEVCARNKPISECAMLEVSDSHFNVSYFTKDKEEKNFNKKLFSYERIKS
ncbi:MAG: YfcE family phosphodiesterase [Sulfurimonas sp.]|uniref:YfcE family phosphodiesterase n=1 Tax=Sulfurimonas sp. TaxID=2022749 RepID=UPI0025E03FBD|nr:YfcE family phosphodiesterase [Sulfurimonas sp.]MCK9492251.1 YfcE family phosphodiesterase [Sulfurimonas sp.]